MFGTIPDRIVEIVSAGCEDVFDIEVNRTENFIANGLVSHNTRWHQDDLGGRILAQAKETGEDWAVLKFPAIADHESGYDELGRKPGEPLWPERWSLEELRKTQMEQRGSSWFSALYQQEPQPAKGVMFLKDKFRYFRIEHHEDQELFVLSDGRKYWRRECMVYQTIDTAMKTGRGRSYTVIGTFARTPKRDLLVIDMIRKRIPVPEQYPLIVTQRARYPDLAFQAIEDKASGIGLVQQAAADGMPFRRLKADTDKQQRVIPVATMFENEKVYFLGGAAWLEDYEHELLTFPTGANDDQVDVTAYAGIIILRGAIARAQGSLVASSATIEEDERREADAASGDGEDGEPKPLRRPGRDVPAQTHDQALGNRYGLDFGDRDEGDEW